MEQVRITRRGGEVTPTIPSPVTDYEAAARLVWEYLRGEAERHGTPDSYDGRRGWQHTATVSGALRFLWPALPDTALRNSITAVGRRLRASESVVTLQAGRNNVASVLWVAAEYRAEPVAGHLAVVPEPAAVPAAEVVTEPAAEPAVELTAEPAAEVVTEPAAEVAEPAAEVVTEPAAAVSRQRAALARRERAVAAREADAELLAQHLAARAEVQHRQGAELAERERRVAERERQAAEAGRGTREAAVAELAAMADAVGQREAAVADLARALLDRERQVAARERQVAEREVAVAERELARVLAMLGQD